MIQSRHDLRTYVRADVSRHTGHPLAVLVKQPQVRWQVYLRTTEWWCNCRTGRAAQVVGALLKWRLQSSGIRLGYTIPINRFGPGLRLPHWGTIVVNGAATVGAHCQVLPDVVIGGNDRGAPTIGDNVYVGPGVKVIGDITVGDGAVLVAGAVITKDVPAGEHWGGVPAKRLPT
jgi:serine O-acetyltransferase